MGLGDDERVLAALAGAPLLAAIEHHPTVTSTNDVALEALRDGAAPGLVIVADRQTAGRGRAGRSWTDDVAGPAGPGNLAVTVSVPVPARDLGLIPLATGVAVHDAYAALGAVGQLKWPNDVLLDGRKAAGILVERHRIDAQREDVLLIGIGLDLDWRGVDRDETSSGWVSVAEVTGQAVDRGAVLAALLVALSARLDQLAADADALRREYRALCATLGREVQALLPSGATLTGTALDIDADGRLQVDTGHDLVAITAGDVSHLRAR